MAVSLPFLLNGQATAPQRKTTFSDGFICRGKIKLKDAAPIPYNRRVLTTCGRVWRTEGDMFQIWVSERDPWRAKRCWATVSIAGYRSQQVYLAADMTVNLLPLGADEGSTMSFTADNAPREAVKAYADGYAAELEKNWTKAQRGYEEAVTKYPKYAAAWDRIAECAERAGKIGDAADALARAEAADPRYLEPYVHWTGLAISQSDWNGALLQSEKAIALNPVEFPKVYLFRSVAALSLGQWKVAELAASQAISNDPDRKFALAEYVMAVALDRQNSNADAAKHYREYLELAPRGPHAAEATTRISSLNTLKVAGYQ